MATEYVDAGAAVPYATLSTSVGKAPPVTKGVTYERILNARDEPQNWLTYYGAYDGQRYSPLDQINTENVRQLTPQWVFQAGNIGLRSGASTYAFEASPIVVDGVMFVSGWDGWCWALDARNGQELWRYRHASPFDVSLCCGNVNRGVAVAEGLVFMTTLNAHIIALDAETGKKIWDKTYGDVRAGESATVAPLVVKDMVIVGSSGGEFGVARPPRRVQARDRRARLAVLHDPEARGARVRDLARRTARPGSAAARTAGSRPVRPGPEPPLLRDRATRVPTSTEGSARATTSTPIPASPSTPTPARSRRTSSTPRTTCGTTTPSMEHILFDLDGQKLAAHFDKNGFMYILDRTDMSAVRVAPFVDRIDWGEVDEKGNVTPKVYPDKEGDPVHFWPGPAGAKEWTHACYSPNTELLYVPRAGRRRDGHAAAPGVQGEHPVLGRGRRRGPRRQTGYVSAFDPRTGQERWRWTSRTTSRMCSSLLATGGDLVFGGEPTGSSTRSNAETGDLLWQFQCGSGHHSSPSTYSVDGRQYIVVPTGWGAWTEGFLPGMLGASHGSALFVFALPE